MKQVILLFIVSFFSTQLIGGTMVANSFSISSEIMQQDTAKQREAKEAAARKAAEEESLKKEKEAAQTRDPREAAFHDAVAVIETPINGYSLDNIEPSNRMKAELDKKIEKLKLFPDMKIVITGHTCDRGSEEANVKVAQKRADAVKDYMVSKGVKADHITTESKGKEEPIEPNTNNDNRSKNRRVEFKVK